MVQKPIGMEQLKQVIQLYSDGISICEIARRIDLSLTLSAEISFIGMATSMSFLG
jgi:hypothetical protein